MTRSHPYKQYEGSPVWKAIEKGIADLVNNGDLDESTARDYIVGYLTKLVVDSRPRSSHLRALRSELRKVQAVSRDLDRSLTALDEATASSR